MCRQAGMAFLPAGLLACRPTYLPSCRSACLPACLPPRCNNTRVLLAYCSAYWPAFLPTGLPAYLPAYPPPDQPSGLPACLPSWLSPRCHVFPPLLILPACLPDHLFLLFNDSFIFFTLPTCRHADGRGHTFSPLLDLPACLPAGSPFSTLNISFSLPSCLILPACLPDHIFAF